MRRLHTLCVLAALGLGAALTGGPAHAADGARQPPAAAASAGEDFNGDGYQDLAIGAPDATVSGHGQAGYVVITYGSATGPDTSSRVYLTQSSAGISGTPEEGDRFGEKLISRDLDGDGLTDLAVHSAGEDVAGTGSRGMVTVLWGRTGGLSGDGSAVLKAPADSRYWSVGSNLTGGDFDGDGNADLFMEYGPDWDVRSVLRGPFSRAGEPAGVQNLTLFSTDNSISAIAAGDMTGDGIDDLATFYAYQNHAEGGKFWRGTASGLSTVPAALPSAATAVTGDFDKDGIGDLATRVVPGGIVENLPDDAGTVRVHYGTPSGPGTGRVTTIDQDTPGVPGTGEKGDNFGARLSAGDANGDGYADLAAAVPYEAIGNRAGAGAVVLLKGGSGGLTGTGAQAFHQDTPGIPGIAETGDHFGDAVRLLDVTRDGRAELAASAPEESDTGAVWSLRGTASGLTATGSAAFNPVDLGIPAAGSRFGAVLSQHTGIYVE
ncbi:FG-GAP repeat protein [Streptomyces sp. WAC 00631]|uniref:FG-GAP repeat protein n=1 Tax=Streptomyces sp. WAC 00631 TaxID=2203201 RepID=UPI000F76A09D|nr:FG-GAP repeat protein [Streptomyces sp. WAC 00631]MCC5032878.1 FG-GAP repeat protein [Streptomyces sp. WAC 00631]